MALTTDKMPMAAAVIAGVALLALVLLHRGFAGISVAK